MVKKIVAVIIFLILLIFCLVLFCSCTLKYKDAEIGIMQMQVRDGSASIYDRTIWGPNIRVPLPLVSTNAVLEISGVYLNEKSSLVPIKADGSLPNIIIDLTQDDTGFSNTYATGDVSNNIYPKDIPK